MSAQPRQTPRPVLGWDLDDVPDVQLNRAMAAGQDPQAFIAARNVGTRELTGPAAGPSADRRPATSASPSNPALQEATGQETEADGDEDLGLFGPDKPDLEDIRAGEDTSAAAWAENPGEWPPPDPWVRRGLHNLVTRMTEELDAAAPSGPEDTVIIRASDLDNLLTMAISALYEADARSGQRESTRSRQIELEAD